jgi:hypothetical protein
MLVHRDEETNEVIQTLVDKKKKKKLTLLKKGIHQNRQLEKDRKAMRKEHRERINLIIKEEKHDGTDYETLYEETDAETN